MLYFAGLAWSTFVYTLDINDVIKDYPEIGRMISAHLRNNLPQLRLGLINFLQNQVKIDPSFKKINYGHTNIYVQNVMNVNDGKKSTKCRICS